MAKGTKTGGRDWKPGESGNPRGRPAFSIVSIIKAKLQGVPEGRQKVLIDILVDEYIDNVRNMGTMDGPGMRDLIDRFDGKPKQHIQVDSHLDGAWGEYLNNGAGAEPEAMGDTEAVQPDETEAGDNGRCCAFGEDGTE